MVIPKSPSVMMGFAGAGLVAATLLVGLIRGNGEIAQGSGAPSLLEILEEVRRDRPERRERLPSPQPPQQSSWSTPLRGACRPLDPALRAHLNGALATLPSRTLRLNIHPTNYGERLTVDAFGHPLDPTPRVVVLHETVYGLQSAINTFLTPHPRDEDQVSYHVLIGEKGEVIQVVDPLKRAFGAGNSAFSRQWAVTNRDVGGSVNNFALHLSLETPLDGEDQEQSHSGYTTAQYDAMALVLAQWMERFSIPVEAITTHRHVDLAGERADPRSFDWKKLQSRLQALGLVC